MSKILENTQQRPKMCHKIFYIIFHHHLYELARYWNLPFLAKISPKTTFYVSSVYYIITICTFTTKKGLKKICNINRVKMIFSPENCGSGFSTMRVSMGI